MAAACAACNNPLTVTIEPDSDVEDGMVNGDASNSSQVVPDDVHLHACGHHFHWSQCLVDAYSVNNCPSCAAVLTSPDPAQPGKQRLLCHLNNEGGQQEDVDILPELSEEGYLKAYPEERRARAFIEFCRQGDLEATLGVLQDEEEDELATDVLRYQDQLSEMQSTLQAAVVGGNENVAWLLLYLASDLPMDQLPPILVEQAQGMGLERGDTVGKPDVRGLKDLQGRNAENIAMETQGPWMSWLGTGRLSL